jgi:hypothetical protein
VRGTGTVTVGARERLSVVDRIAEGEAVGVTTIRVAVGGTRGDAETDGVRNPDFVCSWVGVAE